MKSSRLDVLVNQELYPVLVCRSASLSHCFQVDYIDVMLLHATDCEEEGGRLSCGGAENSSTRTWEDAWRELETTVDEGEYNGDAGCTRLST